MIIAVQLSRSCTSVRVFAFSRFRVLFRVFAFCCPLSRFVARFRVFAFSRGNAAHHRGRDTHISCTDYGGTGWFCLQVLTNILSNKWESYNQYKGGFNKEKIVIKSFWKISKQWRYKGKKHKQKIPNMDIIYIYTFLRYIGIEATRWWGCPLDFFPLTRARGGCPMMSYADRAQ